MAPPPAQVASSPCLWGGSEGEREGRSRQGVVNEEKEAVSTGVRVVRVRKGGVCSHLPSCHQGTPNSVPYLGHTLRTTQLQKHHHNM